MVLPSLGTQTGVRELGDRAVPSSALASLSSWALAMPWTRAAGVTGHAAALWWTGLSRIPSTMLSGGGSWGDGEVVWVEPHE